MSTFQQPNSRARALHHLVDQLVAGSVVEITFASLAEARDGLAALAEVAALRQVRVGVAPTGSRKVEVRLVEHPAA